MVRHTLCHYNIVVIQVPKETLPGRSPRKKRAVPSAPHAAGRCATRAIAYGATRSDSARLTAPGCAPVLGELLRGKINTAGGGVFSWCCEWLIAVRIHPINWDEVCRFSAPSVAPSTAGRRGLGPQILRGAVGT